jgi:hypothetical protein
VELAALTAGIDVGGQVAQQETIELSAGERGVEAPRVDACEPRAQTAIDHLLRELTGRNPPDGEERLEPGPRKLLFSIPANVLQEQIAERRVRESIRGRLGNRHAHPRFVNVVRTRMRKVHNMQRQSSGARLRLENVSTHAVHRHAIHCFVHRCQQR